MNWLILLIGLLKHPVAADTANHWTIGSRVHATASVCARLDTLGSGGGTCGTGGTLRVSGDKGTIAKGPAGGTTAWGMSWYIHYDTPPDGWSTQAYLALDSLAGTKPPSPVVKTLLIVPPLDTLFVGQTVQLIATALDSMGKPITGLAVAWGTTTPLTISVSSAGLVTALAPGFGQPSALVSGLTSFAAIIGLPTGPARISVSPLSASVPVMGLVQARASVFDAKGAPLTSLVIWSARNAVATVDQTGLITALAVGVDTITAASGTVSASLVLTSTPALPIPPQPTAICGMAPPPVGCGMLVPNWFLLGIDSANGTKGPWFMLDTLHMKRKTVRVIVTDTMP